MRPLIWSRAWAAGLAGAPFAALMVIELGTSRTADRNAANDDEVRNRSTSRLFDVAAGSAITIGFTASLRFARATIRPRVVPFTAGVALMTSAVGLSALARRELGRFHRNALTVHADQRVIDSGPYRYVRHPIYTATGLAFAGIGLTLGNWLSVGAALLPGAALVHRITVEEAMLLEHLGDDYASYRTRTDRLLPGVW